MPQFTDKQSNFQPTEPQWPRRLQRRQENNGNKIFFRLPCSYVPFFQAMAEDHYMKGKIPAPSIGLLAKMCLITAGNAWNRILFQLVNKENDIDETRFPRKPWHPYAQTLQSTITIWDYRLAVEAAREVD